MLAAILVGVLMGGAGGPQLSCSLAAVGTPKAGGPAPVRFTVENKGSAAVRVLDWHTPLEGLLSGQAIEVSRDGKPIEYQGPQMKRGDPGVDDYVAVGAGKSVSKEIDVALAFDLTKPGTYRVRFAGPLLDVLAAGEKPRARDAFKGHPLACGPVDLVVQP